MKNDFLTGGVLAQKGTVTREMVHARAAELVAMDGRSPREATMSDFAQAKRELTGEMASHESHD
jgi:hypothetical protein